MKKEKLTVRERGSFLDAFYLIRAKNEFLAEGSTFFAVSTSCCDNDRFLGR